MRCDLLCVWLTSSRFFRTSGQQQHPPLQQRAPHGLAFESPVALSPSAFEFFHPNYPPNGAAANAPLPVSMARADRVVESAWEATKSSGGFRGPGAGGVVATVIGVACVVLVAVGISYYYLVSKRKSETAKAIVQFHPYV
ncbi:hypothetical protein J5N97_024546 [Dioscorea zingiberensis]|uniref:Uncharacterized protein n=1 Tax=Dioscorea zingiberensis TaxID=325984 RepID=A0A9D5C777_9LILI|nr:hypothetical protein J5N97_024546 [Dioscorea zingiberensis]